ncbi:hypothetical protein [Micrococcus luteus]|uniref:hypothetical protein n=1 Tax=Micrococcus luteus TaxID=1270 RepID=UPI00119D0324|nr:hypothetical protein [Micrococcus luteus]
MNRQRLMALTSLTLLCVAALAGALLLWTFTRPAATPEGQAAAATTPAPASASMSTTTPTPTAGPLSYAPANKAEEVAVEAARIMTTWKPAEDLDESASAPRAAHLMTPARAKKIFVSDRGTSTPEWIAAAEGNWTSEPNVTIVPDSDPNAIYVNVTWTWREPEGKTHDGHTRRMFVFQMTDDKKNPQISDYTWQNLF